MRDLQMTLKLDGKTFGIGLPIEKDAPLVEYEKVLNAINRAMIRLIKKKYFEFSKRDLILDCIRKEKP